MQGLNSRKGTCRSRDDLLAELADLIITAAVAMSGIAGTWARRPVTWNGAWLWSPSGPGPDAS
jgi:hypothetical protein